MIEWLFNSPLVISIVVPMSHCNCFYLHLLPVQNQLPDPWSSATKTFIWLIKLFDVTINNWRNSDIGKSIFIIKRPSVERQCKNYLSIVNGYRLPHIYLSLRRFLTLFDRYLPMKVFENYERINKVSQVYERNILFNFLQSIIRVYTDKVGNSMNFGDLGKIYIQTSFKPFLTSAIHETIYNLP